ncbi:AtpZ/AtpI family protein [Ferroacidibacillus organovorans]|uniref:AtpZ/AtpI family protein n=1 Tax=Ferroacidibacillus organovorans TaxID=1765683 RepID=UPI003C307F68
MVSKIKDDRGSGQKNKEWKAFAVFSGASLQLLVSMIVFGFLGHALSQRWNVAWPTLVGVLFGLFAGVYGLSFLIKRFLGEKP